MKTCKNYFKTTCILFFTPKRSDTAQQSRKMRNAVCILKTGLLHVGFKNFGLLHCFEKVNLVLDKSLIQGSMDKFVN